MTYGVWSDDTPLLRPCNARYFVSIDLGMRELFRLKCADDNAAKETSPLFHIALNIQQPTVY